ncbi:tyrosine-type recombinase/integrase [Clostridium paraputrificum]|uniref:tyrosine-type recombinase/integrase n=1 Tax=Clostridium paraputrificum TaxID=29363 RepID=UPI003F5F8DD2
MSNLNEELSVRLVGKLTLLLPELEINLQKQIDVKKMIDNILYEYEVATKCTSLSTSDIKEKARLYIACKKLEGLSDKTLKNYIGFLSWLDQYFNKPCSTITTMDLRMFLDYKSKGKMASTVNGYITYLKNFFTWLQDEEYIISNPARKLKSTKVPKLIKEAYKSESLERMRDACITIRDKALFEVLESTACRISEISTIRLDKINWSEKSVKVHGKGNKERIVYFSTRAKIYMLKYLETRDVESPYLFIASKKPYANLGPRSIQRTLKEIKERSGVEEKVYAHKFRRTQATHLLNSGMSLQGVQKFLGHESPETTQRYAQISQENLKNEYKRLVS